MNAKLTRKRISLTFAGAAVVTAGTVGGAAALAGGDDDAQDHPIPASELERAEVARSHGPLAIPRRLPSAPRATGRS